jgi:hypothetical protein
MANSDAPRGLTPVRHRNGAPYNGAANVYVIPASDGTAVFIGDAVKSAGSADAEGVPTVARAAAGDAVRGVVVGVLPDTRESLPYRAASTLRKVLVADDPDLVFEIQEDSVGGALTADEAGENADLIVAAGSTLSGRSGMELDSSTHTTSSAQFRILRLVRRPDNEIGANAKWEVAINEHELAAAAGV